MRIGNIEIKGQAALAPMAGVTDGAFRQICGGFGAAYTVSEMLSAKAMEFDDKKTASLADISHDQEPVFLQLFGAEPLCMARAAEKLCRLSPAGIDINMGCPMPKITGSGAGSALMKEPKLCGQIVRAVKEASGLPVTVKLRSGWEKGQINALEVAKRCEEAGADGVCVHARTRDQLYQGQADWGVIKAVKAGVRIPVIGNGDVTDAPSAEAMLAETGCDMVMVGRGALGNPWVFREINGYLRDGCQVLPPPTVTERLLVLRKHMGLMCEYKGEGRTMREARKHAGWYMKGMRGAAELRRRAGLLCTIEDLDRLIEEAMRAAIEQGD